MSLLSRNKTTVLIGLFLVLGIMAPFLALAQAGGRPVFANPLTTISLVEVIARVTRFILGIVGFIALLSLVWGGVLFIIAFGNEEKLKTAKQIIFWSIAGLVIIILAFFIVRTVSNILGVQNI